MKKSEMIAREMNRAIAGKSKFFPVSVNANNYKTLASNIANIENVDIIWRNTRNPVAQIYSLRRFKRALSDHPSKLIGYIYRNENGEWRSSNSSPINSNPRKRAAKSVKSVRLIARKGSTVKTRANPLPRRKPSEKLGYIVQEKIGETWRTISRTDTQKLAEWIAQHVHKHTPGASIRVMKE